MTIDFTHYWSLTGYQRHCIISTNYFRMKGGQDTIPIPPAEVALIESGHYFAPRVEKTKDYPFDQFGDNSSTEIAIPQPRFSFFNPPITNTLPAKSITLAECARLIQLPYPYLETTEKLRALPTLEERKAYKARHLAYVTFSGIFSKRITKSLITHSGLICMDLDHLPNPEEVKMQLRLDYDLQPAMIFISPSRDGLKVIVPIDIDSASHSDYFDAVAAHLLTTHGLQADPSGRDVARACFLCYDPFVYLNSLYNDWR
jgi:hypothetical protein